MITSEFLVGQFPQGMIVRIVGRGTMQESPAFRALVDQRPLAPVVVLDATDCEYMDSTFLGCLIWMKKSCEGSPKRQFLIAASPATRIKLFSTTALGHYFEFIETCPEPLNDLVAIDVEKLDPETLGRHVMRCHELLADMGGEKAEAFRRVANRLSVELGVRAQSQSLAE